MIVDNTAMQLVMRPEQFDVMVTTNMFGDILSDEVSGLVGGLGLAPGANIGTTAAIFEAVHGSAPDIAGQGIANPSAQMLAAAMMLDHMGELDRAQRVRDAVRDTIVQDNIRTRDLGGTASHARSSGVRLPGGLPEVPCAKCERRVAGLSWGELCPECRAERQGRATRLANRISLAATALMAVYVAFRLPGDPCPALRSRRGARHLHHRAAGREPRRHGVSPEMTTIRVAGLLLLLGAAPAALGAQTSLTSTTTAACSCAGRCRYGAQGRLAPSAWRSARSTPPRSSRSTPRSRSSGSPTTARWTRAACSAGRWAGAWSSASRVQGHDERAGPGRRSAPAAAAGR